MCIKQTSSGKTFTMNGTSKQPGLIPQAIYMCFDSVGDYRDREFLFRVSYLEIYNETVRALSFDVTNCCIYLTCLQVHDLLNPDIAQIRIQHDPKLGTVLSGVKEQVVMSPEQVSVSEVTHLSARQYHSLSLAGEIFSDCFLTK